MLHAANRHVERWAPEASASRVRPLRTLGFVDRLVRPWLEVAQRSASLRMFQQYLGGVGERQGATVSWVFPRPWYQDELDWMAAARVASTRPADGPMQLTTRGTYVAPSRPSAVPPQLFEYVAPSLSIARTPAVVAPGQAYAPLVPFAAAQAARVMTRAIAPLTGADAATRMSPGLRAVLAQTLARAAQPADAALAPTRLAALAPELVTPPAPRAGDEPGATGPVRPGRPPAAALAQAVAEQLAARHAQIVELQRIAQQAAQREIAARVAQRLQPAPATPQPPQPGDLRADDIAAGSAAAASPGSGGPTSPVVAQPAEPARPLVPGELASRTAEATLHARARAEAARDAQHAVREAQIAARDARTTAPAPSAPEPLAVGPTPELAAIATALAALPAELAQTVAAGIARRPDRAAQAIAELGSALHVAELLAHTAAAGQAFVPAGGPRIVLPAGLGGLAAALPGASAIGAPRTGAGWAPSAPPRRAGALAATEAAAPAALHHVAWADRWLARFAGASSASLEAWSTAAGAPQLELRALGRAAEAPEAVFVAPATSAAPAPEARPVLRFDDDAETPDDVFASIAAASARARTSRPAAAPSAPPSSAAAPASRAPASTPAPAAAVASPRQSLADLAARTVPAAPGAGLSAQLASSPFAPALRHVMPVAAAPRFDVRALFGGGLGAAYLGGLLSAMTSAIAHGDTTLARAVPGWEAAYIAPSQPLADDGTLPDASRGDLVARAADATSRGDALSRALARGGATAPVDASAAPATLRSALLAPQPTALAPAAARPTALAPGAAMSLPAEVSIGHALLGGMALPLLGERLALAGDEAVSFAAPGSIGDRAYAWAIAQERSAGDLAFDFVSPELVLAARVYGLGPAQAAQAARLAIAGPGQLGAMASAVDRTFVQALAIEAARADERHATEGASAPARAGAPEAPSRSAERGPVTMYPAGEPAVFGIARRSPRGAFLWPSAAVAALGLAAPAPDGDQSMSVAALELLAAQAVAELGTFAALGEARRDRAPAATEVPGRASETATLGAPAAASPRTAEIAGDHASSAAPHLAVLAQLPAARRAKFEALYVALGQSPAGRSGSPAARAARALALAGRGGETLTAHERAQLAWNVLPLVQGAEPDASARPEARTSRRMPAGDAVLVDSQPGLAALSARAGEALGSYVAPASATAPSPAQEREAGAVLRAPTAAQELVRPGRPAARHGGGETEIPSWFEAAARRMFQERGDAASAVSVAELTYVTAAPSTQVAASTRSAPSAAPATPAPSAAPSSPAELNIEKIANDIYREILAMMDIARARNGEPYL